MFLCLYEWILQPKAQTRIDIVLCSLLAETLNAQRSILKNMGTHVEPVPLDNHNKPTAILTFMPSGTMDAREAFVQ